MLTDKAVQNLKPRECTYEVADDRDTYPGLRLRISPKGKKTWFYRYQHPATNKIVKLTLGIYGKKDGQLSLAAARSKWEPLKILRDKGIDPKAHLASQADILKQEIAVSHRKRASTSGSIRQLIKAYIDAISSTRKSWKVTERILQRELEPYMDLPAHDLTRSDVRTILKGIETRKAFIMANRTLAAIRGMYNWAIRNDWPTDEHPIETNPCLQIRAHPEKERERTLSEVELKKLLKGLPKSQLTKDQQDVLLFTLLTGCRVGEACQMEWSEIHGDEWRQPGSKTKNGRSHIVYLSPQAKAILKRHKGERYVFASKKTHHGYLRLDGIEKALRNSLADMELQRFTPHDLRRTFATWMGDAGIDETVHDRVLNHYQKSIRKTYNLARYNKPAKSAWLKWGRYIAKLQGAN